jgi:hypothetical protein
LFADADADDGDDNKRFRICLKNCSSWIVDVAVLKNREVIVVAEENDSDLVIVVGVVVVAALKACCKVMVGT